ncbi:MAG TPA: hypothetical protein VKS60_25815 [Stellaceae bacterium]|nr:hypothetical protein [Stellaceae bacterium]
MSLALARSTEALEFKWRAASSPDRGHKSPPRRLPTERPNAKRCRRLTLRHTQPTLFHMNALAAETAPRYQAAIIGGDPAHPIARRRFALGMAWEPEAGTYIVSLTDAVPQIGITFEARDFDHAFERALAIGADMAASCGYLDEGVLVSLTECASLGDIGVSTD